MHLAGRYHTYLSFALIVVLSFTVVLRPFRDEKPPPSQIQSEDEIFSLPNNAATHGGVSSALQTSIPSWCESSVEWIPSGEKQWQKRAPAFMLLGAKKAGTTALTYYLEQHPSVISARTKELKFFRAREASYMDRTHDNKVDVAKARQLMRKDYKVSELQGNPTFVSFDASPYYLFYSAHLPRQILCICPWIKILALLRDPVERVWSNYYYNIVAGSWTGSLEDMIDADIENLRSTGVIEGKGVATQHRRTDEQERAWKAYTEVSDVNGVVGRSLYVFQVRPWFRALEEMGRNPKEWAMMIQSEEMDRHRTEVYGRVLEFLNLPTHELAVSHSEKRNTRNDFVSKQKERLITGRTRKQKVEDDDAKQTRLKLLESLESGEYKPKMTNETRQRLQTFFAPFNQQLYDLLGNEWQGAWDNPKSG